MRLTSVAAITLLVAAITLTSAQDAETRRHLLHELSGPFIVFRPLVQKELKLSEDQKRRLDGKVHEHLQAAMDMSEKLKDLGPGEQEKAMQSLRQKSGEKFWAVLRSILRPEQLKRFQQLELQHEGPSALFRPSVAAVMKITPEQKQQVIRVIQELSAKLEAVVREAQAGGNSELVLQKAIRVREDYDRKVEALLSAVQKKRWRDMRGQPFDVWHN